jgi:hypothetical protein
MPVWRRQCQEQPKINNSEWNYHVLYCEIYDCLIKNKNNYEAPKTHQTNQT